MSLPEISRRCGSCGAAVRAGARFCPHCGQPVGAEGGSPSAQGASEQRARGREATGPAVAEGRAGVEATAPQPNAGDGLSGRGEGLLSSGGALADAGSAAGAGDAAAVGDAAVVADGAAAEVERRGRVARVREATRERVGRVRDEALVALEETPDDSGLRFVVAAVALFLLFAFLLFLSVTVLR